VGIESLIIFAISTAISVVSAVAAKKKAAAARDASLGQDVRPSDSAEPLDVHYGFTGTSGTQVFVATRQKFELKGNGQALPRLSRLNVSNKGKRNEFLLSQRVIGIGEIEDIVDMWIDDQESTSEFMRNYTYAEWQTGTASTMATAFNAKRTVNDEFKNITYASNVFKLNRDDPQFSGAPTPFYFLKGNKIKDITAANELTTTRTYSANLALVILDYVTSTEYGPGWDASDLDLESFKIARDICDEVVSGADIDSSLDGSTLYPYRWLDPATGILYAKYTVGYTLVINGVGMRSVNPFSSSGTTPVLNMGALKRYQFNGSLSTGATHRDNIGTMLAVAPGIEFFRSPTGQWKLVVPNSITSEQSQAGTNLIDDSQLITAITISYPDATNRLNQLDIRFPSVNLDLADSTVTFPETSTDAASDYKVLLSEDNEVPLKELQDIRGIVDKYHAKSLAGNKIAQSRRPIYSFTVRPAGFLYEPGDIVEVYDEASSVGHATDNAQRTYIKIVETKVTANLSVQLKGIEFHNEDYGWRFDLLETVSNRDDITAAVNPPIILPVTFADRKFTISWDPNAEEDATVNSYIVEAYVKTGATAGQPPTNADIGWTEIAQVRSDGRETTDGNYIPYVAFSTPGEGAATYYYRVRAKTSDGRVTPLVAGVPAATPAVPGIASLAITASDLLNITVAFETPAISFGQTNSGFNPTNIVGKLEVRAGSGLTLETRTNAATLTVGGTWRVISSAANVGTANANIVDVAFSAGTNNYEFTITPDVSLQIAGNITVTIEYLAFAAVTPVSLTRVISVLYAAAGTSGEGGVSATLSPAAVTIPTAADGTFISPDPVTTDVSVSIGSQQLSEVPSTSTLADDQFKYVIVANPNISGGQSFGNDTFLPNTAATIAYDAGARGTGPTTAGSTLSVVKGQANAPDNGASLIYFFNGTGQTIDTNTFPFVPVNNSALASDAPTRIWMTDHAPTLAASADLKAVVDKINTGAPINFVIAGINLDYTYRFTAVASLVGVALNPDGSQRSPGSPGNVYNLSAASRITAISTTGTPDVFGRVYLTVDGVPTDITGITGNSANREFDISYRKAGITNTILRSQSISKSVTGAEGNEGVGIEYVFQATNSETAPTNPLNTALYDQPTAPWTDGAPTLTALLPYLWRTTRKVLGAPTTGDSPPATAPLWGDWATPTIEGRFGGDGLTLDSVVTPGVVHLTADASGVVAGATVTAAANATAVTVSSDGVSLQEVGPTVALTAGKFRVRNIINDPTAAFIGGSTTTTASLVGSIPSAGAEPSSTTNQVRWRNDANVFSTAADLFGSPANPTVVNYSIGESEGEGRLGRIYSYRDQPTSNFSTGFMDFRWAGGFNSPTSGTASVLAQIAFMKTVFVPGTTFEMVVQAQNSSNRRGTVTCLVEDILALDGNTLPTPRNESVICAQFSISAFAPTPDATNSGSITSVESISATVTATTFTPPTGFSSTIDSAIRTFEIEALPVGSPNGTIFDLSRTQTWSKSIEGTAGAAGSEGVGIEYVFQATNSNTAPTSPLNTSPYDTPTSPWTDGAPALTSALPNLWRTTRKVLGAPAAGAVPPTVAPLWGDWATPTIEGRFGDDGDTLDVNVTPASIVLAADSSGNVATNTGGIPDTDTVVSVSANGTALAEKASGATLAGGDFKYTVADSAAGVLTESEVAAGAITSEPTSFSTQSYNPLQPSSNSSALFQFTTAASNFDLPTMASILANTGGTSYSLDFKVWVDAAGVPTLDTSSSTARQTIARLFFDSFFVTGKSLEVVFSGDSLSGITRQRVRHKCIVGTVQRVEVTRNNLGPTGSVGEDSLRFTLTPSGTGVSIGSRTPDSAVVRRLRSVQGLTTFITGFADGNASLSRIYTVVSKTSSTAAEITTTKTQVISKSSAGSGGVDVSITPSALTIPADSAGVISSTNLGTAFTVTSSTNVFTQVASGTTLAANEFKVGTPTDSAVVTGGVYGATGGNYVETQNGTSLIPGTTGNDGLMYIIMSNLDGTSEEAWDAGLARDPTKKISKLRVSRNTPVPGSPSDQLITQLDIGGTQTLEITVSDNDGNLVEWQGTIGTGVDGTSGLSSFRTYVITDYLQTGNPPISFANASKLRVISGFGTTALTAFVGDSVTRTYPVTYKQDSNSDVTVNKIQSLSKALAGNQGAQGLPGLISWVSGTNYAVGSLVVSLPTSTTSAGTFYCKTAVTSSPDNTTRPENLAANWQQISAAFP